MGIVSARRVRFVFAAIIALGVLYCFTLTKPNPIYTPGPDPEDIGSGCRHQTLSPSHPHVLLAYGGSHKPACAKTYKRLVEVKGHRVSYPDSKVTCDGYRPEHHTDDDIKLVSIGTLSEGQELSEDFLIAKCSGGLTTGLGNFKRNNSLAEERKKKIKASNLNLDIVMVGFDSISGPSAVYMLNDTFEYFEQKMGGIRFQQMNIVGDGTPQAMIPMFTGKSELELPHARRDQKDGTYVDRVYPFIQREFADNGYLTSFFERSTRFGVFQYRFRGFEKPFTDFDGYTYFKHLDPHFNVDCFGDRLEMEFNLDAQLRILERYPDVPKFLFPYSAATHESPLLLKTLKPYVQSFLEYLNQPHVRQKTIVILMSDHGPRYAKYRKTYEGRIEERNPFFAISLPDWLKKEHPYAWANALANTRRLTTPFDVHETLLHLMHGLPDNEVDYEPNSRGISLFHPIPSERTCQSAGIALHWCLCASEKVLAVDDSVAKQAAEVAVSKINSLTEPLRKDCVLHELQTISSALLLSPQRDLLKFSGSVDKHGFDYEFSDNIDASKSVQVTLVTLPLGYTYEVTVRLGGRGSVVNEGDISMLSEYLDNPHCIAKEWPSLRKFCICNDKVKT